MLVGLAAGLLGAGAASLLAWRGWHAVHMATTEGANGETELEQARKALGEVPRWQRSRARRRLRIKTDPEFSRRRERAFSVMAPVLLAASAVLFLFVMLR